MKQPKSRLLVLVREHRFVFALIGIAIIALYFRLLRFGITPPGLHIDEASYGIRALNVLRKSGALPLSDTLAASQPLLYLHALAINFLGNTVAAVRVAPFLISCLSVAAVWLWAKDWFGWRVGLIATFFVAVSPWALTFGRLGLEAGLALLFVPLTLWALRKSFSQTNPLWTGLAGLLVAFGLWSYYPLWALLVGLAVAGAVTAVRQPQLMRSKLPLLLAFVAAFTAIFGLIVLTDKQHTVPKSIQAQVTSLQPSTKFMDNTSKTILMFNYQGDNDYRHNIAGLPMLNLFVGIMLLLGLLVAGLHFRYPLPKSLLIITPFVALPALTSQAAPDARLALMLLPLVAAFSALGIDYMLDAWYKTFPINSAARGFGTLPIALLLGLTAYQGYQQYFVAWAKSPETYEAYNERAHAIAGFMNRNSYDGERFGVLDEYDNLVVGYLTYNKAKYNRLGIGETAAIPKDTRRKQFIITRELSDSYLKALKAAYPKARLSQHYSEYNDDNELFAVYEVLQ
jgi:hypothetical protein